MSKITTQELADRWPEHRSLFRVVNYSLTAAIDHIESLQAEVERLGNPWVRVDERLPPRLQGCDNSALVFLLPCGYGHFDWVKRRWYVAGFGLWDGVTDWMPIPQQDQEEA